MSEHTTTPRNLELTLWRAAFQRSWALHGIRTLISTIATCGVIVTLNAPGLQPLMADAPELKPWLSPLALAAVVVTVLIWIGFALSVLEEVFSRKRNPDARRLTEAEQARVLELVAQYPDGVTQRQLEWIVAQVVAPTVTNTSSSVGS